MVCVTHIIKWHFRCMWQHSIYTESWYEQSLPTIMIRPSRLSSINPSFGVCTSSIARHRNTSTITYQINQNDFHAEVYIDDFCWAYKGRSWQGIWLLTLNHKRPKHRSGRTQKCTTSWHLISNSWAYGFKQKKIYSIPHKRPQEVVNLWGQAQSVFEQYRKTSRRSRG